MSFAFPLLDAARDVLVNVAPGMPADYWWVTACVLFILTLAATIDAFTGLIPDALIFLGLLAIVTTQGFVVSWEGAAQHLRLALGAGFVIWAINQLWYFKFRHDALGMGDAKWTMLAVACFGLTPALFAWGVGAIVAIVFIQCAKWMNYRATRVTFAPFLLLGLCVGLYWARFAG